MRQASINTRKSAQTHTDMGQGQQVRVNKQQVKIQLNPKQVTKSRENREKYIQNTIQKIISSSAVTGSANWSINNARTWMEVKPTEQQRSWPYLVKVSSNQLLLLLDEKSGSIDSDHRSCCWLSLQFVLIFSFYKMINALNLLQSLISFYFLCECLRHFLFWLSWVFVRK